jgi:DNA ligase (NAD+)
MKMKKLINFLKKMENERLLSEIFEKLRAARLEYNNNGENLQYTDEEYDALLNYYKSLGGKLNPEEIRPTGGEVLLHYPMPGLDKLKDDVTSEDFTRSITKFMNENRGPYILSDKIDGTSLQVIYDNGKLFIYSGGDGITGTDVSYMQDYIEIPKTLPAYYVIRGELTIDNEQFKSVSEILKQRGLKGTNSRSAVNGMVIRKTVDLDILPKCKFVAFNVLSEQWPLSHQFEFLSSNGFTTPSPTIYNPTTVDQIKEDLLAFRLQRIEHSQFRIDGIVVVSDPNSTQPITTSAPSFAFAFKQDTCAFTTVIDVKWRFMNRYGTLIPVVHVIPTNIIGNTINKATGHNAKFIITNKIGIGSIIEIKSCGDVIPGIVRCIEPRDPILPTVPHHWDENKTHLIADNFECYPQAQISRMLFFVNQLGIMGCGETMMVRFYEAGIRDIGMLIRAKAEFLQTIDRMGEKSAFNLVTEIRKALEKVTYPTLMAASCIFPKGIGKTIMASFISYFPGWEFETPTEAEILSKHGFGPVKSKDIAVNLPIFKEWLNHHPECRPRIRINSCTNKDLIGQTIVFTGFTNPPLKQELEDRGAVVKDNWVNSVTLVLAKDINSNSGKVKNAKDRGIPVQPFNYFDHN